MPLFKTLIFTLIVPCTVAGWIPWLIARSRLAEYTIEIGWWRHIGLLSLLFGVGVYLWTAFDFATFGRGTPAPVDPPKKLVVRGLYRWSRNPMYVGIACVILGQAMLRSSVPVLVYLAAVVTGFSCFVVWYEEPKLLQLFGDEYRQYCRRVGRWLG